MKKIIYSFLAILLVSQFIVLNVRAGATDLIPIDKVITSANDYIKDEEEEKQYSFSATETRIYMSYPEFIDHWNVPYTAEAITLENTSMEINKDNYSKSFADALYMIYLLYGYYFACGYNETQITNVLSWIDVDERPEYTSNYDKYGLLLVSEPFKFEEDSVTISGDFVRKFVISLDSSKTKVLFDELSGSRNPDKGIADDLEIIVNTSNVSTNEIAISALAKNADSFGTDVSCNIYKSESITGDFVLVGSVSCDGVNYLYDKNLDSNKTYYYKASIVGDNSYYSEVIEAKTLANKSNGVSNPDTGSEAYVIGALILVVAFSSFLIFGQNLYLKK